MLPAAADHARIARMLSRLLAVRFFAALGLVAVIALLDQVLVQVIISRQAADSQVVDRAGRQRMHAYQIAAGVMAGADAGGGGLPALAAALDDWRRVQQALAAGDAELGIAGGVVDAALLAPVEVPFRRIAASAEVVLAGGPGVRVPAGLLADVAAYSAGMDRVVQALAAAADSRVARMRWLGAGLFVLLMLALGFVDLFVFRPSLRRVRQALEDLEQVKRFAVEQEVAEANGRLERRIGQDLHDGVGQRMTGVALMAKALSRRLAGTPDGEQAAAIAAEVNEAVAETRALSRQLFPAAAETQGLGASLRDLASTTARLAGIECACDWDDDLELPAAAAGGDTPAPMHLFRIVQEAVNNAVRHGKAKRIQISGYREEGEGVLEVVDDGVGLAATAGAPSMGLGMRTMSYRARQLGAAFEVREDPPCGTTVCMRWPLASQ